MQKTQRLERLLMMGIKAYIGMKLLSIGIIIVAWIVIVRMFAQLLNQIACMFGL